MEDTLIFYVIIIIYVTVQAEWIDKVRILWIDCVLTARYDSFMKISGVT